MSAKEDPLAITGKRAVARWGYQSCQIAYRWVSYKGWPPCWDHRELLSRIRENWEERESFIQFILHPTEDNWVRLPSCFCNWLPLVVAIPEEAGLLEKVAWVYSNPDHIIELFRLVNRPDTLSEYPPRYKEFDRTFLEWASSRVPKFGTASVQLPLPPKRKPYTRKSSVADDSDSESESLADPGREEAIFSRMGRNFLNVLQKSGLTIDSPTAEMARVMANGHCPLAYKCNPGRDCPSCVKLTSFVGELKKRGIEAPQEEIEEAEEKPIEISSELAGKLTEALAAPALARIRRNVENAALAQLLLELRAINSTNVDRDAELVLRNLFKEV